VPEDTARRIESFNSSIGLQKVETQGTREALSGRENTEIFLDYRGVPVLSSYRPLSLPDVRWVIMSEIDKAEAFASVEALKTRMVLLMGLFLAAILGISFVLAKNITHPIKVLTTKAESLAKGDLDVVIDTSGGDEVSRLARNFDVMRKSLRELVESLEEKVRERTAELEKNRSRLKLALDQIESVNSVIMRWNSDGLITGLNSFGQELFGFTESEVVGQHVVGTIVPKTGGVDDFLREMIDDILGQPEKYLENENKNFRKDGSSVWMMWRNNPIVAEDGSLEEIVSIGIDITRQKELERELSIANKRMGDELNIGRQIQMSMIPLTFPRFPEHKDLDVWAFIRPAREVGGDFYDFFFINERLFAFVVADVSGKGVPAALLMAVAKTLLKSNSQDTQSTAKIVQRTNNELSLNNKDCMFITAFFGIIDTKTGELTYTNAGHNPPYLMSPNGAVESLTEIHGPMIGVMEGTTYDQTERTLGVDDKLVLYTDGVTEAFNPDGELFGEERLSEFLTRSEKLGTKYLVDALVRDIDEFAGEEEQSDDITLFCLRHVAWDVRDDRARIELHLVNELSEIDRCLKSLNEFCERFDLPPEVRNDFGVVLDDLLNNIISYAFEDEDEHLIEVSLATDKQRFIVTLSDDGVEFDPFLREEPDVDSDIKDRQVGGLGIHLARSLMDDFSYRRIEGKNVTILMKRMGE
jgi:sigma-B regulation protein RsbU (phosphoserine phosphatase)